MRLLIRLQVADDGFVNVLLQKSGHNDVLNRLADMGDEPDRRKMLERVFAFMDERGTPIVAVPTISKIAVDLFRLYHIVKDFGGMVEVCVVHFALLVNVRMYYRSGTGWLGATAPAGKTIRVCSPAGPTIYFLVANCLAADKVIATRAVTA